MADAGKTHFDLAIEECFTRHAGYITSAAETRGIKPQYAEMPRTFVGRRYGTPTFKGVHIPRVLALSINQSMHRHEGEKPAELAPQGGRPIPATGFGPRALAANVTRWLYKLHGLEPTQITPEQLHEYFAYDNFVKWTWQRAASTPDESAWKPFNKLNADILGVLEPDVVVCIGKGKVYNQVYRAMQRWDDYGYKKDVPGWLFHARTPPWGRRMSVVGVYHYSRWGARKGGLSAHMEKTRQLPATVCRVLNLLDVPLDVLEKEVEMVESLPWWDGNVYKLAGYDPIGKLIAWRLLKRIRRCGES